jgi:hypothetical protein
MNEILMIEIIDYRNTPPCVAFRFWWSVDRGLTCDKPLLFNLLQQDGILIPGFRIVYPSDGRAFFDALPFGFNSFKRAQPPVVVEQQGGEPL